MKEHTVIACIRFRMVKTISLSSSPPALETLAEASMPVDQSGLLVEVE